MQDDATERVFAARASERARILTDARYTRLLGRAVVVVGANTVCLAHTCTRTQVHKGPGRIASRKVRKIEDDRGVRWERIVSTKERLWSVNTKLLAIKLDEQHTCQ